MRVVLLPGMDGTGELFERFVAARPPGVETQVVSFPCDEPLGYAELARLVTPRLPDEGRWLLLGESFSGPLALRIAAASPPGLAGVVLAASFIRAPGAARHAAPIAGLMARARPPRWALARLLTGGDRRLAADVHSALGRVAPLVTASRLRAIAGVDARDELRACPAPMLVIRATDDRLVGPNATNDIASARPDASVVEISAPHLVLQTASAEAWRAVGRSWPPIRDTTDAAEGNS